MKKQTEDAIRLARQAQRDPQLLGQALAERLGCEETNAFLSYRKARAGQVIAHTAIPAEQAWAHDS